MNPARVARAHSAAASVARLGERLGDAAAPLLIFAVLLLLGCWNLAGPAPWWDEGWTLSTARNVAERGFYGRLLEGQPAPPGLEAAPAVTLSVATIFRWFGSGLWQGRLFGVVCAAGAVALAWWLAAALYGRRAAWGAVAALMLLATHPQLNPLLQGRQVLGELPMLLALLGGYACLLRALRGTALWIVPTAALWALALVVKAQAPPFLAVSLLCAVGAALMMRRWQLAVLALAGGVAAFVARPLLAQALWELAPPVAAGWQEAQGVLDVTAIVPQAFNRLYALQVLLFFAMPAVVALVWALRHEVGAVRQPQAAPELAVLRWALLGFAGSWTAWFVLLSVGVPRYLFPATFVAAVFVGAMLADLTAGFDLGVTLRRLSALLARRGVPATQIAGAWLATLLVAISLPLTLLGYARYYPRQDGAVQRVAAFLNERTPPDALVETYEAELHFFLDRPYHYPPDPVHVALNRRGLLGQDAPVEYDPLAADPDYLVIGQFARGNRLYADVLAAGDFRLLLRDGAYELFERVRRTPLP